MKENAFKLYALVVGVVCILSATPKGSLYVNRYLSDDSQLTFYASLNDDIDTNIVVLGTKVRSGDTLKNRLQKILSYRPKAVYIDIFYDSLEDTERFDGLILLPIVGVDNDVVPYHYSINNFTTREAYGVAQYEDIFYVPKYFDDDGSKLPSVELAIIKEFDPALFENLSLDAAPEIVSYIPASNFFFHCLDNPLDTNDTDLLRSKLRDKIVVIGNFDTSDPDPYDTWDVHSSPIGRMHGAFLIANGLHTLVSDRIYSPNKVLIILAATVLFAGAFVSVTRLKIKNTIILAIVVNLSLVVLMFGFQLAIAHLMDWFRIFISQQTIGVGLIAGAQLGILHKLKHQ
jgi:hypothetical protein